MAKRDQKVVAVIDNLTPTQAASITADIHKSKSRHAPNARVTAASGHRNDMGKMLSAAHDEVGRIEDKGGRKSGKKK